MEKNLWDNFKTLSSGNVEQKNGTYIATTNTIQVDITPDSVGARPLLLKANNAYTFSLKTTVSISRLRFICLKYTNGEIDNFIFANQNFVNFVPKRDVEKVGFILYDSVAGDKAYDAQLEMGSEATPYEPYHEQNVILPYTLNAIPVPSGGNYTDENGQQWVCDEVDLERGVKVQKIGKWRVNTSSGVIQEQYRLSFLNVLGNEGQDGSFPCIISVTPYTPWTSCVSGSALYLKNITKSEGGFYTAEELKTLAIDVDFVYQLVTPIETPLTPDEIAVYKTLHTYTGITNISNDAEAWMQVGYRKVR